MADWEETLGQAMGSIGTDELLSPKKVSGSNYSKEHKLKRYYSILREFMTHFHRHDVPYPASHEFTEDELRAIEPQHIMDWLNMKMFGTLLPDFSGETPISGSHHTIAFYRKGIGYFMPGGTEDWDPLAKTGNPTRSKTLRDLINKVKELNHDGVAKPRKQLKKRSSEEIAGDKNQKPKKKGVSENNRAVHNHFPFALTEEVNGLLRQMHTQKHNFMRSLEQMSAAVEMMKSEVEISYGLMIGQVSNLGSRIAAAQVHAPVTGAVADEMARAPPRARNLFAIWGVQNGRLTPLGKDWNFPNRLTVREAMKMWLLGEPGTNTPPLQYVTVGHMKHIKGAAEVFNKVRRLLKIFKYLGLKFGYWCGNWDNARIVTLWEKIIPGIEIHLGHMSVEDRSGNVSCRTMINTLTKQGGIIQEMAANPHILTDEHVESYTVRSTEEVPQGASTSNEEREMQEATPTPPCELEFLWGIHHGKLNPLPAGWCFPAHHTIVDVLKLWLIGDPEMKIPPLQYLHSGYVTFLKSGTGYLSKLRCVMKVVKHIGTKLDCWHEDHVWSMEKITTLWRAVSDDIEDRVKFAHATRMNGCISWQSVYNRMHEKGIIKEVNDQEKTDQDLSEEVNADQEKEADQVVNARSGADDSAWV